MSTEKKIYMSTDYTGEAIAPHQQFVTDAEGNSKWEEKLCWDNGTVVTTLVDNVSVTLVDSGDSYAFVENPFEFEIIEGKEYIIIWNGTSYTCTAYTDSFGYPAIGKAEIIGATGSGNEEPFFMDIYNETLFLATSTEGTYTISIQIETENIHKIAPKYVHTPDWNAKADEVGYIANKTHWEEIREGAIINNLSFPLSQSGNYYTSGQIPYALNLSVGSECTVIWDGNSYNLVIGYHGYFSAFLIGNESILGFPGSTNTGEPFLIMYTPNSSALEILCTSIPASQVLTVHAKLATIHKLDVKYLPDEALRVYTHPTYTALTGAPTSNATPSFGGTFTISQITSNSLGHVTNLTNRTVRIPNSTATTSTAGLMSAADKTKLDELGASDWNQNDETAMDYIKNRTHWIENGEPTIWVNNVTLDMTNTGSLYNSFTLPKQFTLGDEYTVILNNTEYKCIAYIIPGPNIPGLGSASFIGGNGGNGEPFLLFSFDEGSSTNFYATSGTTYTITIKDDGKIIHRIPLKYLPSLDEMDAAKKNHTHYAGDITGGTFNGNVSAGTSYQSPTQSLLRNSKLVTTETNPSYNGEIYWTYE